MHPDRMGPCCCSVILNRILIIGLDVADARVLGNFFCATFHIGSCIFLDGCWHGFLSLVCFAFTFLVWLSILFDLKVGIPHSFLFCTTMALHTKIPWLLCNLKKSSDAFQKCRSPVFQPDLWLFFISLGTGCHHVHFLRPFLAHLDFILKSVS